VGGDEGEDGERVEGVSMIKRTFSEDIRSLWWSVERPLEQIMFFSLGVEILQQ
jgi:hypothetical protein